MLSKLRASEHQSRHQIKVGYASHGIPNLPLDDFHIMGGTTLSRAARRDDPINAFQKMGGQTFAERLKKVPMQYSSPKNPTQKRPPPEKLKNRELSESNRRLIPLIWEP